MARPLRLEFDGALYHVHLARRRAGVWGRFNWTLHAYCLMTNHYHLLVETPEGNLAKGMRQLNGVYTQRFNCAYQRVGHVFQGRYKAILVQISWPPYSDTSKDLTPMAKHVVNTALLQCSFGVAPSTFTVTPEKNLTESGLPAANIADQVPMKNIMPFGMCNTVSNPAVASATAAAAGALTPMPCIPVPSAPWMVGAVTVLVGPQPGLSDDSKCLCSYGGVISVTVTGQFTVDLGSSAPAAGAVAAAAALNAAASNRAMQDEADRKKKEAEEALANAKTPEEQAAARAKMAEAEEAQRKASTAKAGNALAKAKRAQVDAQAALANAKTPEAQAAAKARLAKADQAVADAQA